MIWNPIILLKLIMSIVFIYHGVTKNASEFANAMNLSTTLAFLVMFAEISAGLGYLLSIFKPSLTFLGLTLAQWASIAVVPVLVGAIILVHSKNGFNVMNNGFEYQLVLIFVATYVFLYSQYHENINFITK